MTELPVTPLGRGVALVRVTDPPTAMAMEDEGEGRMEAADTKKLEILINPSHHLSLQKWFLQ